jgi:molybdopterin/thiamine biosynthesis adenylyltransferase
MSNNYHIRQTGLIDPAKLTGHIAIVGAGGIGSWTSLALLKMGCPNVSIIDFDEVEEPNLGSQLYTSSDIGKPKVEALRDRVSILTGTSPDISTETITNSDQILSLAENHNIIISAVDNMAARDLIFKSLLGENIYFIDGRMAGNVIQIFIIKMDDTEQLEKYQKTLFTDNEASIVPCSERAVVYNVFVMAGLITDIVAKIANNQPLPWILEVDLLNLTLFKPKIKRDIEPR